MQRFKNILLVLDPEVADTAALDKAASLARQNKARLTFFSVLKTPRGLQSYSESIAQHQRQKAIAERVEWLRGMTPALQKDGIDVAVNVLEGIAFLEIIRQVLRDKHDLVITIAEEKNGIRARVFGTTSLHLMRKCPCPVWVVKRAQLRPFKRILAAVDPIANDQKNDSLNSLILQLSASIARREVSDLHIIHAWRLFREGDMRKYGSTEKEVQQAKVDEKMQHKERLDKLLGRVDVTDLKPHLHFVEGDPEESIPGLVQAQGIDLLVMGSVCRTGIAGFLIGNTAEEVLNQVDCSVMTIKPDSFVTPVTLEVAESNKSR